MTTPNLNPLMLNMVNHPKTAPSTTSWWFFTNPFEKIIKMAWSSPMFGGEILIKHIWVATTIDNSWDPKHTKVCRIPRWIQAKALGCNPFKEISSKALMALFGINHQPRGPSGMGFWWILALFRWCFFLLCQRLFLQENYGEMIFSWYIVMNRSLRTRINVYNKNRKSQTNKSTVGYEKNHVGVRANSW